MADSDKEPTDVLPPVVNALMALVWLLLFGGRWLIVLPLQALGAMTPEQVTALDDGPLTKIYVLALAVTLLVLALRAVRRAQTPIPGTKPDFTRPSDTEPRS